MKTYGKLSLDGRRWKLEDIEPHVVIRLKQIFPRIPKTSAGPFHLPADLTHAADLAWFTSRYPLQMSEEDREILEAGWQKFEDEQAEAERILMPDWKPPAYVGLRPGSVIRHYQAQAVELLNHSQGLLLGDDVGLGKTFTAAAACLSPGALPAAVVCQSHLAEQWARVIRTFTTLRPHVVRTRRPYLLPQADVYIFRYSILAGWVDHFRDLGIRLAVYDEIQELRRGLKAEKGQAAARLSRVATRRLGLSATPIYNYGTEMWNIMIFLKKGVLGTREEFIREWCHDTDRIKDPKALGTYLREQRVFLRRTKADVGQEMPKVNRIVQPIDYDEATVRSVDDLARQLAIKATTASFVERGQAVRELDIMVRQQTGIAKARQVAQFARMVVESGEPVVLVGWHREVYAIWLQALEDLKPVMYTGSESSAQKDRAKEAFVSGETDILILSLRSGVGLDGLQYRCSTVIIGELDWSPGVHDQVIGRVDREGQTKPVTAFFLVAEDGSDPPMMEVNGLKRSESTQIVDPTLGAQVAYQDGSYLQTLVQRYLTRRKAA